MIKHGAIILFFLFQPTFAMHDLHLAVIEQRKVHELDLLLKKKEKTHKSINLTLLRFDQLSEFLQKRSPQEIVKLQKYMSPDMRFFCDVAIIHKDIAGCIHAFMGMMSKYDASIRDFCLNMMFDSNQETIEIFEKLDADAALQLYEQLKPIKQQGQSIVPLFLAHQEDRKIMLNILKPWYQTCCSYSIITEEFEVKLQQLLQKNKTLKPYVTDKKIFVLWDSKNAEKRCINSLACLVLPPSAAATGFMMGSLFGGICCNSMLPAALSLGGIGYCGACGGWGLLEYSQMREVTL